MDVHSSYTVDIGALQSESTYNRCCYHPSNEVTEAETRLEQLDARKAVLLAQTPTVDLGSEVSTGSSAVGVSDAIAERNPVVKLRQLHRENLFRLSGITGFRIPYLEDGLGIRFDMFTSQKFDVPHYVILRREQKTNAWQIYRHTVPNYIPLRAVAAELLQHNLLAFAKRIRRLLYQHMKLKHIFEQQRERLSEHVTGIDTDKSLRLWKLTMKDGSRIDLVCSDTQVERSLLHDGATNTGRPYRRLLGPLDSLHERLMT